MVLNYILVGCPCKGALEPTVMAASLVKFPDKLDSGVTSEIAKDEWERH